MIMFQCCFGRYNWTAWDLQDVHSMMKQKNPDAMRGFSHDHRGHRQAEHLKARGLGGKKMVVYPPVGWLGW